MRIPEAMLHAMPIAVCAVLVACQGEPTAPPPPPPVAIAVTAGSGQITDVGPAFPQPIGIKVSDASGVGVKGVTVAFVVSAGLATVTPASTTM